MERKKKEKPPRPDPPEGSCHFFVERKRRYCRFTPAKGVLYCAEHASLFGVRLQHVFPLYTNVHGTMVNDPF